MTQSPWPNSLFWLIFFPTSFKRRTAPISSDDCQRSENAWRGGCLFSLIRWRPLVELMQWRNVSDWFKERGWRRFWVKNKTKETNYQDSVGCGESDGIGHFDRLAHPFRTTGHRQQLVASAGQFQNVEPQGIGREFHLYAWKNSKKIQVT